MGLGSWFRRVNSPAKAEKKQKYMAMVALGGMVAGKDMTPYLNAINSMEGLAALAAVARQKIKEDAIAAMRAQNEGRGTEAAVVSLTNAELAAFGLRMELESSGVRQLKKLFS